MVQGVGSSLVSAYNWVTPKVKPAVYLASIGCVAGVIFQPTSFIGYVGVAAVSIVVHKGKNIADYAVTGCRNLQLRKYRTCPKLLDLLSGDQLKDASIKAFTRFERDGDQFERLKTNLGVKTRDEVIDKVFAYVFKGFCKAEVDTLISKLAKNPKLSSATLLEKMDLIQIVFDQIQSFAALALPFPSEKFVNEIGIDSSLEEYHRIFPKNIEKTSASTGRVEILFNKGEIGGKKRLFGHCLFFQCGHGFYRFYDSNHALHPENAGFYEFESKEHLLINLRKFLINNYYNHFVFRFTVK